jgi:hypothetical protein
MKALATWSPAPFLSVTAIQREESRRLVTVYSRERACCPVCGVQSSSRHSFYSRTLRWPWATASIFAATRAAPSVRGVHWRSLVAS